MKILLVYYNYPQLSATYVEAEIRYLISQGIEVEVWSQTDPGSSYVPSCIVHRGRLRDAEDAFRPDIVHYYWGKMAEKLLPETNCPVVTVRSHSFALEVDAARRLSANGRVKSIFMFPDQASRAVSLPNILTIPVAYDTSLFPPIDTTKKQSQRVICTTAGLPAKALEDLLETARLCPEFEFELVIATCEGNEHVIPKIQSLNAELGANVEILVDVPHAEIPILLQDASFYMCTQKEVKRGMPIAIAEALASGCFVFVPDFPWLEEMVGPFGCTYSDPADAAAQLKATQFWSSEKLSRVYKKAPDYAHERYGDVSVLPQMVECWKSLL